MFKKIALCTMLVLILAPAAVMAAGQQGPGQGIGNEAGNSLNVQHQMAIKTAAQEQSRQGQGSQSTSANGDMLMVQTRSCDQSGDQDKVRNMTRDQIRLNTDAGAGSEIQGSGSNGDARMLRTRSCDETCDQDTVQDMTRDQLRLRSDSADQLNGMTESDQNRFGLTSGNGQNMLARFTEQLGFQFRHMGEIFQALSAPAVS